uniref:Uncharacterized protein n=1 Tax=Vitis vinifera TaxID=29760 RepID=F6HBE8_VITVI
MWSSHGTTVFSLIPKNSARFVTYQRLKQGSSGIHAEWFCSSHNRPYLIELLQLTSKWERSIGRLPQILFHGESSNAASEMTISRDAVIPEGSLSIWPEFFPLVLLYLASDHTPLGFLALFPLFPPYSWQINKALDGSCWLFVSPP